MEKVEFYRDRRCFFCGEEIGPLESTYLLSQQSRPYGRYAVFGYACELCGEHKQGRYRTWKGERP